MVGPMPYGLSDAEVEWVREGYRMFREGDPAFMDRYEPDAKFIFPDSLPSGGTHDGPFAALEFWTTIGEHFDNPAPEPEEFLRVDDRMIVFGTWRARSRATGEELALRIVHVFGLDGQGDTVMDQKIVSVEVFSDSAAILEAMGPAPG
jgi:ketosteroid isomerase-like protein